MILFYILFSIKNRNIFLGSLFFIHFPTHFTATVTTRQFSPYRWASFQKEGRLHYRFFIIELTQPFLMGERSSSRPLSMHIAHCHIYKLYMELNFRLECFGTEIFCSWRNRKHALLVQKKITQHLHCFTSRQTTEYFSFPEYFVSLLPAAAVLLLPQSENNFVATGNSFLYYSFA